jgi:hypothetical protein
MLPASLFAEITTNIAALQLEPNTAAQILAAVFAPLLQSSDPVPEQHASRPGPKPRRGPRQKRKKSGPRVTANGAEPMDAPRQRAIAALQANPDATLTRIAEIADCSHSTAVNARKELAAEVRKEARKEARKPGLKPELTERRHRAQRFLKDALAHGPKQVSEVEDAAERAHIDEHTLGQARADLGVVVSRGNAGGVQVVQWSLPG